LTRRAASGFFDDSRDYAKISAAMKIVLDIPAELFDDDFTAAAFEARVAEFAVIELVRAKRLHEHEAARMLEIDRWNLLDKMERAGILATETEFDRIKGELGDAIEAKSHSRKFDTPGRNS
jgi:hypothetical protein